MAAPVTPTMTLARVSPVSFSAALSGDAGGAVYTLRRRKIWSGSAAGTISGSVTNPGTVTVTVPSEDTNAAFLVWAVASNGEFSLPAIDYISLNDGDTVAQAVKRRWDSLPNLVDLAGPLFTQEVPEKIGDDYVSLPYSWVNVGSSNFDWTFENMYFETVDLEFLIRKHGLAQAEEAASEFRNNFDWENLAFSAESSRCLMVHPYDAHLENEMVRYKDGQPVFLAKVCYRVTVERQLS